MIYSGQGFLAVVRFGSSPIPSPLSRKQAVFLSQSTCVSPVELTDGRGGGGAGGSGRGDKSNDREKAWPSINCLLSANAPSEETWLTVSTYLLNSLRFFSYSESLAILISSLNSVYSLTCSPYTLKIYIYSPKISNSAISSSSPREEHLQIFNFRCPINTSNIY